MPSFYFQFWLYILIITQFYPPQVEGSAGYICNLSRWDEGVGDGSVLVGVEGDKVVVDGVEVELSGEVEVRVVGQVHRGGLSRQGLYV